MFFALGLKNVWRNRGRTLLGIISMAVAAVVFTSSSVLSQGYPAMAARPARDLLAGDLVFLPGKTILTSNDLDSENIRWSFDKQSLDNPQSTLAFDVAPYYYGRIKGTVTGESEKDLLKRLDQVALELQKDDVVRSVTVKRSLPFLITTTVDEVTKITYGFLEARTDDAQDWGLIPEDGDSIVGAPCLGWQGFSPGNKPVLEIPKCWRTPQGQRYLDYADPLLSPITLTSGMRFRDITPEGTISYACPSIFVSEETFDKLASAAGFTYEDTVWGLGVRLRSIEALENLCATYQRKYNDLTVLSSVGLSTLRVYRENMPVGTPMDMRKVTEMLAFLTAALLSATNLAVLMLQRKTEIGILRSLGATSSNVASMVLTEVVFIAVIGAVIGSLLVQPSVAYTLASNNVDKASIANQVLSGFGSTLAFAVVAASLFGILPIAKALRVTPAQVLRGD